MCESGGDYRGMDFKSFSESVRGMVVGVESVQAGGMSSASKS